MSIFRYTPVIFYKGRVAPNIIARVKIPERLLKLGNLYHPYVIEEGDRPESIAELYYGDPNFDWLVRLPNNIYDEASQWPLTQTQLERYLRSKYDSVEYTLSTIDHYELKSDVGDIDSAAYDALTTACKRYWHQLDNGNYRFISATWSVTPETWASFVSGEQAYWQPVTVYDKEFNANEEKRLIRLIDERYKNDFDAALKIAMQEANDG